MEIHELSKIHYNGPTIVINFPNSNEYNRLEMLALYKHSFGLNDLEIYNPTTTINSFNPDSTKNYIPGFVKFFISRGVINPYNISIKSTEKEHSIHVKNIINQITLELENGFKEYKDIARKADQLNRILPKHISLEKLGQE